MVEQRRGFVEEMVEVEVADAGDGGEGVVAEQLAVGVDWRLLLEGGGGGGRGRRGEL